MYRVNLTIEYNNTSTTKEQAAVAGRTSKTHLDIHKSTNYNKTHGTLTRSK